MRLKYLGFNNLLKMGANHSDTIYEFFDRWLSIFSGVNKVEVQKIN